MLGKDTRSDRNRVLLIADDIIPRGGIRTRVLGELSMVSDQNDILLIVKTGARNFRVMQKTRNELSATRPGMRVVFVPLLPHHGLPVLKELNTALNSLMLFVVGLVLSLSWRPDSIYSHNMECSMSALALGRLRGLPVTSDLHGDEVEENVVGNGWLRNGFRHRLWRTGHKQVVVRSNIVVCVSNRHKVYLEQSYGRTKPTVVVPCCIDASHCSAEVDSEEALKDLDLTGHDCTLVYSGSPFKYQMIDEMIQMFRTLRSEGVNCALLMLVSDVRYLEEVRKKFDDGEMSSVRIRSVEHERVLAYSSCADVAMLFREDTLFNNISSPTKFAEYLCAGLPVLMTKGIGDYSNTIEKLNLGRIVDLARISEPKYASAILHELMANGPTEKMCRDYVQENISWSLFREPLLRAFSGRE